MKAGFIIFLLVHGIIHLLGFVKAFGMASVPALTQPISRQTGIIWLLVAILFAVVSILFALQYKAWWMWAVLAAIASQWLIVLVWKDAKFGTLANVLVLLACLYAWATAAFFDRYTQDVRQQLMLKTPQTSILTQQDLAHLPDAVKKYLHYAGVLGKPKVHNFKIVFHGKMRKDESSAWMPFTSEQYNFIESPTRLFFMNARMMQLPVAGYHAYQQGKAFMDIRLLSLFRVQYVDGKDMDIAETVTFFNDMCCMAPATLIDKRITWQTIGPNEVAATFTHMGISIQARLFFNEAGQLTNFISNDRLNAAAGKRLPWSTPLSKYTLIDGRMLPGYAEASYRYPAKDFVYGTFNIQSIEYNIDR
jgi:hypothetical protein